MELIPIAESHIAREKKLEQIKKKLKAQLDLNIAHLKATNGKKKLSRTYRLYRVTNTMAEIELPTAKTGKALLYAVLPSNGESVTQALVSAFTQLTESLATGALDAGLLDGPQALTTPESPSQSA